MNSNFEAVEKDDEEFFINEYHKSEVGSKDSILPSIRHSPVDERKVTLYVPCYNAQQYIGDCLEGILKQTYPIEEILVIDDGCTDRSMEIVSQYPVKIVQHKANKGLAAARNTAIQNATGDFIASLDSDCVPEPDWLERLMENFTSEDIAGVGGKLLESHTTTVADLWRSVHLKQHWGDEKINNPDFLFGADNVYRKDALMKVGLYNEEYRTNYEDCDMFERVRKAGYTTVYEPKAIALHLRRDDICSVVTTCWNWNKHVFQKDGCFDNFERLTQKINLNTVLAARYLMEDITKRKVQILYPDLLVSVYHTLLDLKFYHSSQSAKTPENQLEIIEQTFNALIILATWTAKQKSPDTELYKLIGEDLLKIQLDNSKTPPLSLEELMEELNAQASDTLNIDKYPSLHETYLNHFFNSFQQLFDQLDDPLIVKMIEVSAKAARRKEAIKSNIFIHLFKQEIYDAYDELASFTGEPRETVISKCAQGCKRTAESFYRLNPQTPEERLKWYTETDSYLYELTHWEAVDYARREAFAAQNFGYVLDYGCGIGAISLIMARCGSRVESYDISKILRNYLNWRVEQRGWQDGLKVLESETEFGVYDSIVCLHVLEHVEEPLSTLQMLFSHLKEGGVIYCCAPFYQVGKDFPEHLEKHKELDLRQLLTDVGFTIQTSSDYCGESLIIAVKEALP